MSFAQECDLNIHYDRKFVELNGFDDAVKSFIKQGGKGANVTAPFKEQAMAMCDILKKQ